MADFLTDQAIEDAVGRLLLGGDIRLAVAFWGAGAARAIFGGRPPSNARLVCDVTMGGSNPRELEALGAPSNPNVRHLPGLHAKVYMSDLGVLVGSANASSNGLGLGSETAHVEAATSHSTTDQVFAAAAAWFESTWLRSVQVDERALVIARRAWVHRPPIPPKGDPDPTSLLDAVADDPDRFRGVGFAFTSANATTEERDAAFREMAARDDASKVRLLSRSTRAAMAAWPLGDVFSGWAPSDVDAWPGRFVCAHRNGRGRIGYWFYERRHVAVVDGTCGMVFAERRRHLRRELGFRFSREVMAEADQGRLEAIFEALDESGHRLFEDGAALASLLGEDAPQR